MAETEINHDYAVFDDVSLHYVTAGDGPPVVLLHGFPQTWYEWRDVIPALAENYSVVAPDLRGLGDSSRPVGGYDKKTVANDVWRLMNQHLGHRQFFVVGHDWGGPVAYALAAAHRDAVARLAILDVMIPGDGSEAFATSGGRWHHGFHRTPDLPEALIAGRERIYISYFLRQFTRHPGAISDAAIDEYARTYSEPGAMRAGLAYYRATPQDVADNAQSQVEGKLRMPVLALGGDSSFGRRELTLESMRRMAEDVRGGVVPESGHFIPEEQPAYLVEQLLAFFGEEDTT